jgi:zinc transport system permease protein
MTTLQWLTDPAQRALLLPGLIAGAAIVLMCAVLSVLVVLKRLAFIGQGVSHSAFGGIGVAAIAGVATAGAGSGTAQFFIVLAFCVAAAIGMAMASERAGVEADTAIGVFLVASMALGAVLIAWRLQHRGGAGASWESILFGSIMNVTRADAVVATVVSVVVLATVAWFRRPLLFWAFDEPAAAAFGVPTARLRYLLMILLAVATVTAMKLVGVVLASALLVLPGATALRSSDRLTTVLWIACSVGLVGLIAGMVASLEANIPSGACIVLALTVLFVGACAASSRLKRIARPPQGSPQ